MKNHKKMGIHSEIAAAAIGLLCLWSVADSVPNTNITAILCNSGVYTTSDPFAISLSYVVGELETETPTLKNYDYYNISPYPNAFAYGHAACNLNLTASDCKTCLGVAKTTVFNGCPKCIGARSVLHDCTISRWRKQSNISIIPDPADTVNLQKFRTKRISKLKSMKLS
ncbi:hypothetical protein CR513_33900, partial [Mucuna pruriens]